MDSLFRFVLVGEIQRDFEGVFNKTIIPLALVGYEMIIANSALRASLAIYHLISNALAISDYDVIFTALGGEYKAERNRCRELAVLPKFIVKPFENTRISKC